MNSKIKRALTGIRASGNIHIGNYLGTIKPALELTKDHDCIYFIADLHALTTNKTPELLASQTLDQVAVWLALGLDTDKHILFRQSDGASVTELAWYLSCVTGVGLLEKGHAYKDAVAQEKEVSHGVFAYPVLMAADILLYDPDLVPVGKDQKQHVEMSRNMAGSFNAVYGDSILKLPEPMIRPEVMVVPGLDGRKMSKSYGNEIPLFCPEQELKKKVMSIKTDSSALEAPKELEGTLVGQLYTLFGTADQYLDLSTRMKNGGMGWGHAKDELFQVINSHIAPARKRYEELRSNETNLRKELAKGAEKAKAISGPVLKRVREAIGLR